MTKRALLLISDTGGGHRSAANAITAALDEIAGARSASSTASKTSPPTAPSRSPSSAWATAWPCATRRPSTARSTMRPTAAAATGRSSASASRSTASACATSSSDYRPDVIVSVHPLLNHAALRARADAQMNHVPDRHRHHRPWQGPRVVAGARCRRRRRAGARSLRARALARRLAVAPAPARPPDPSQVRRRDGHARPNLRAQLGLAGRRARSSC